VKAGSIGTRVVDAIASQDAAALEGCFAPDVSLRALVPPGVRERTGAGEAAALVSAWFADARPLELVNSTAEAVVDRLHLAFRLRGIENGEPFVVEQNWYCDVGKAGIERADLLCSGFRRPG
jgi:hypothetical protein